MKTLLALTAVCILSLAAHSATSTNPRGYLTPRAALPPAGTATPPGTYTTRVSPLLDARGTHPGLTRVPAARRAAARALIGHVHTAPAGSHDGYERDKFGSAWTDDTSTTWGRNGCRTREDILLRDLRDVQLRSDRCVVLSGVLPEPYLGRTIRFSKADPNAVQIDHVVALSYAWTQGASRWTSGKRRQLANDPLNLLAVDGPENQEKSDKGPAEWLPDNKAVRCAYAVRFAQAARRYKLPVTAQDKTTMLEQCR